MRCFLGSSWGSTLPFDCSTRREVFDQTEYPFIPEFGVYVYVTITVRLKRMFYHAFAQAFQVAFAAAEYFAVSLFSSSIRGNFNRNRKVIIL